MQIRALSWNLFHGRDAPPDPSLYTWRSRLLGTSERNETHLQVNHELFDEFAGLLAAAEWDVALLQECPPRWRPGLAEACGAESHLVLTSRNWLARPSHALARWNPDLIASSEGGSNTTLVRPSLGPIAERREIELRRRPERRTMAFTRLAGGLCVANLHTTNDRPELAEPEVRQAAKKTTEWAGSAPLILGGDLNLRPAECGVFEELEREFGLASSTAPGAIDHLLARGLKPTEPPRAWPASEREVVQDGLAIRLSDHAPVQAAWEL